MADNVPITAGSGTNIATDQLAGGEHAQFVKLMDGALNSDAKIGGDATNGLDVDVTRLGRSISKTNATGSAAIAASKTATVASRIVSVTCHLSSAPTSVGSLTVTLNANAGAAYDTLLLTRAMKTVTDLVWMPDHDLYLEVSDAIDVAYSNPNSRTYGVQITFESVA